MGIHQLEYFLAVKNAGSFTRAAEHLYVSQPAVTSAIRSLESELGITLFDRFQGKASLTAEGRIFSAHVEEIMKGVVTTIRDMDAMKSLSSGTFAIGISSFLSLPSVLSLIARFLSDHPGIECRVQEGPAEAVAALLEKGELDGAFLPEDPGAGYDIHPLAEVPLALILPKSHPLAEKKSASWDDLEGMALFLPEDFGKGMRP
jgi:DNA-binding transcriptional LysR family regulator